jgi:hypothetical protein
MQADEEKDDSGIKEIIMEESWGNLNTVIQLLRPDSDILRSNVIRHTQFAKDHFDPVAENEEALCPLPVHYVTAYIRTDTRQLRTMLDNTLKELHKSMTDAVQSSLSEEDMLTFVRQSRSLKDRMAHLAHMIRLRGWAREILWDEIEVYTEAATMRKVNRMGLRANWMVCDTSKSASENNPLDKLKKSLSVLAKLGGLQVEALEL